MKKIALTTLMLIPALSGFAQWQTVNTSHTRHTNTGNVGIGTGLGVTPSEKLHVIGNTRSDNFNSVNGIFNSLNSTGLYLRTNSTNRLTILNSNGFVGIGTTSPAELFHVNGNARATQFNSTNGNFNTISTNLVLQTNGVSRLTVLNSNGNVGIGTTSPNYLLQVHGSNLPTIAIGRLNANTNGVSRLQFLQAMVVLPTDFLLIIVKMLL